MDSHKHKWDKIVYLPARLAGANDREAALMLQDALYKEEQTVGELARFLCVYAGTRGETCAGFERSIFDDRGLVVCCNHIGDHLAGAKRSREMPAPGLVP